MSEEKKVLAVDFGERRIGLAISRGYLSEPLLIIEAANQTSAIEKIAQICREEEVKEIVLGLAAGKARDFGRKLARRTGLKVVFWDEVLTSEEALAKMIEAGRPQKKRRVLDDVSAALILREYLDYRAQPSS